MHGRKSFRLFALLATAFVAVSLMFSGANAAGNPSAPVAQSGQSTPAGTSQYVGSETCKGCHEETFSKGFQGTPHFALTTEEAKTAHPGQGCESCHGPGGAHVEAGGDKTKIISFKNLSESQTSKTCQTCHAGGAAHANWSRSPHATNGVSCLGCHSVHKAKVQQSLLNQTQPQLCYGCHTNTKAEFSRPFRHRVNEGLITCNDCHNVHGGTQQRNLRANTDQTAVCFKCHAEFKGPFVYEHVPVKVEGCNACHSPHGSTNPRLLRTAHQSILCLQCHTFPAGQPPVGPSHNLAQRYTPCTMCHAFVHGSNHSEVFFKP